MKFIVCGTSKYSMALSMDRWKGKVAIVTGAGAGIGAAITEHLVDAGVMVAGLDINLESVQKLAQKLEGKEAKLHAIKADMTIEEEILTAFKWIKDNLGPVHILVNNAGTTRNTSIIDGDSELWRTVLKTNLLGVAIATREAVRNMRSNNVDGHIININSIGGHKVPKVPQFNMYPPSKFGLRALSEIVHNELNEAKAKIKVTSISPGYVNTMVFANPSCFSEESKMQFAVRPFITVDDVAAAVIYSLSTPPHVQVHELIIKHVNETL